MKLELIDFAQLSPLFIASFMLMNSMFNGDVKAFFWLLMSILGILCCSLFNHFFKETIVNQQLTPDKCNDALIPLFTNFPVMSVSTFFIVFTMVYLIQPMIMNNDWNYYVVVGFLGILIMDTMVKFIYFKSCTKKSGIVAGTLFGLIYSIICYQLMLIAKADKLLYYNTISSNNVYCSKPKKQTFKCYVYKNGEIISPL
jgi:hypothetical protein